MGCLPDFIIWIMRTDRQRMAAVVAVSMAVALGFAATSCVENGNAEETTKVESVELLKTSQSWDGVELPDYPVGKPELRVLRVVLPPHSMLPKHHHDVMSYGIVNSGELTLVRESDGLEKTVRSGEAVVETVGTVHHGENRGDVPTEVIVFYVSQEGTPLSVADE